MATETIVLEVKSNIKSVTTDTNEYAKSIESVSDAISDTNRYIIEQEKQLIKLKAKQDAIPKGAWYAGMDKLNTSISETSNKIKLSKNALKSLTQQQKEANQATKEFTDEQKKQKKALDDTFGSFTLFGLSLKGIKKGFRNIIPTAKAMFGTIKAGLISTGIGALVVAFGVLMTWFSKTKVGAEALEKIFAAVGAVVNVIVDRITGFATAVGKLFSGDVKGALTGMKESFSGIGDEMIREAALALALKQSLQELADAERALNVETAQRKAEIEELRLKARDLNLTEQERIEALEEASAIEEGIMADRIANAEEALRIQESQMSMSKNMAEDLDKLAELEINLANIRREGATHQRTLIRETDRIRKKAAADRKRRSDEAIKQIKKEEKAELDRIEAVKKAQEDAEVLRAEGKFERAQKFADLENENFLNEIHDLQFREEEKLRLERDAQLVSISYRASTAEEKAILDKEYDIKAAVLRKQRDDKELEEEKAVADAKARIRDAHIGNIESGLNSIKVLAGENKQIMAGVIIAENALGIARTIIATSASNTAAIAEGAALAIPTAGASVIAATALVATNNIAAGLSIAASIAAAQQGLSALGTGGATGGGAPPALPVPDGGTPTPQMMSGAFELTGGEEPEPLQAYVVSDEITASQNALETIRRRATI